MGPKKELPKKESVGVISIDSPVNTEEWGCAVVMAVEKSALDSFVLKEFMEEASNGRRREVYLIDYEHFVLKILNYFASGEIPYRYAFLLKFSAIFQDATEYVKNKMVIPVKLLVKVVKALIFFFREESIKKIEKKNLGLQDPVQAMTERPFNSGGVIAVKGNPPKKDLSATMKDKSLLGQYGNIKIRPPSISKEDTKLLKRGEGAKESQCIDDAPLDAFFKIYILLTGFYDPDLPMELIKAQVPLHGVLCIDTTLAGVKRIALSSYGISQKKSMQPKSSEIKLFWDEFLNILWNPQSVAYFKEVIFQVYCPQKLLCEKKKLREFVYKEISYLMYDISDYKRLHASYLSKMKLWNVDDDEVWSPKAHNRLTLDDPNGECVTVPIILSKILDVVCVYADDGLGYLERIPRSFDSIDTETTEITSSESYVASQSTVSYLGSSGVSPPWSEIVFESGDVNLLNIYAATNNLDTKYHLRGKKVFLESDQDDEVSEKVGCRQFKKTGAENIDEAVYSENGIFGSYWKQMKKRRSQSNGNFFVSLDYCLYSFLMSKITCCCQPLTSTPTSFESHHKSDTSTDEFSFEKLVDLKEEFRKPHFTVTECCRSVVRCQPHNLNHISRHFFCPQTLKVVTPERMKASSAPDIRNPSLFLPEISFISDPVPGLVLSGTDWNVYENLPDFLGNDLLSNSNGFDFVEELSKPRLLAAEKECREDYNCVDYGYSVLTDSIFVMLHNRKDSQNSYHEAFNNKLKTKIGLRDFFEYVLEDECQWFTSQENIRKKNLSFMAKNAIKSDSTNDFPDSYFWLANSIKDGERSNLTGANRTDVVATNVPRKEGEEIPGSVKTSLSRDPHSEEASQNNENQQPAHYFEGYDVTDLAVQFSGLKTTHFVGDCSMTVNLIERLYGEQELGVHVRQGGHTLYLYSYVCPVPHINEPFTCHLIYKNGIILAFGKRTFDVRNVEPEEPKIIDSKTKQLSSGSKSVLENGDRSIADMEFAYDLRLSLPNGLALDVLRQSIKPCHIRQRYLNSSCEANPRTKTRAYSKADEVSRLFLPNGTLVKMMRDSTIQILKPNTLKLTGSVEGFTSDSSNSFPMTNYEMVSPDGVLTTVEQGRVTSSNSLQVFQNTHMESSRKFFRRADGTNYVIEYDGKLCVEFEDGTKMCHIPIVAEEKSAPTIESKSDAGSVDDESQQDENYDFDFVFVHEEIVIEHPDYATVIYNSLEESWQIILADKSKIKVDKTGNYFVDIDRETQLEVKRKGIAMNRFSEDIERLLTCAVQVDLTVFENPDLGTTYCKMEQPCGEIYVVEPNSNNYILPASSNLTAKLSSDVCPSPVLSSASTPRQDLSSERSNLKDIELPGEKAVQNKNCLLKDRKYFVVRREMTGFEIVHRKDLEKVFEGMKKGSVVHVREVNGLRCFVIIGPTTEKKSPCNMWRTQSILQNPNFDPERDKKDRSSTYGFPPSWMHPFPKKRTKFTVPELLACRVFVESRRTDFVPPKGRLECTFCEIPEVNSQEPSSEDTNVRTVQEYAKMYAGGDQSLLKNMYLKTAREIANEKKNSVVTNVEKLNRALELIRRNIELGEYHKNTIRYRSIPNYFHHGKGLCWLLLDEFLRDPRFTEDRKQKPDFSAELPSLSAKSTSSFSNEEIEYDLAWSPTPSFSELSCLTNVSSKTAPAVLMQTGLCPTEMIVCKRMPASAPALLSADDNQSNASVEIIKRRLCSFNKENSEVEIGHPLREVALKGLLLLGLI